MRIKPIRTEAEHEAALGRIEQLWGAPAQTTGGDELEVLVTLAEEFERRNSPIDPPDPLDAIRFRLDQQGLDYHALIGIIGQRTRVYEVMRGSRPLSLAMIRRLHHEMQIPAEVLIAERNEPSKQRTPRRRPVASNIRRAKQRSS